MKIFCFFKNFLFFFKNFLFFSKFSIFLKNSLVKSVVKNRIKNRGKILFCVKWGIFSKFIRHFTALAIACPGSCPCQLADCPTLVTERPLSRIYPTTQAPRLILYPPASVIPTNSYNNNNRPSANSPSPPIAVVPALQTGYGSVEAQYGSNGRGVSNSIPAVVVPIQSPTYVQSPIPWSAPTWTAQNARSPITVIPGGGVYSVVPQPQPQV